MTDTAYCTDCPNPATTERLVGVIAYGYGNEGSVVVELVCQEHAQEGAGS